MNKLDTAELENNAYLASFMQGVNTNIKNIQLKGNLTTDGKFKVLGLHQLIAQVFQATVATGDLLGGSGSQNQCVFFATDVDGGSTFQVIHKSSL